MRRSFACALLLPVSLISSAEPLTVPGVPFHPGTAEVVWAVSTNELPETVWIYRSMKREFPPIVVSNLVWLGGFSKQDASKIPRTSEIRDKDATHYANKENTRRLAIYPSVGYIEYLDETALAKMSESPNDIPSEEQAYRLALNYLRLVGVDSSGLARKPDSAELRTYRTKTSRSYTDRKRNQRITDAVDLRGVCFVRWIDSMEFTGLGAAGGAVIEFGEGGKLHQLRVNWRNFEPHRLVALPIPQQIIERIQKGISLAIDPFPSKFEKVTIMKITPFYQGITPDEKQTFLYPLLDVEVRLKAGETNSNLRITVPIVLPGQ